MVGQNDPSRGQIQCPHCGEDYQLPRKGDPARENPCCPHCGETLLDDTHTAVDGTPGVPLDGAISLEPEDVLGGCEIEEQIGHGAMAVVYRARQLSLDRTVALKVLPPAVSSTGYLVDRFYEESNSLASLNHPNIVSIIDRGNEGNMCYFVMEYISGACLSELIDESASQEQVLNFVEQICSALHYAHRRNVVHRDVKPKNIMVDEEGVVKVADFGLAGLAPRLQAEQKEKSSVSVMGTPRYMSPEQREAPEEVDGRSDLYSLGVVIYEMLTGDTPRKDRYRPPSEMSKRVDPRFDPIVGKCLEPDPEDRYQSAHELLEDIEELERQLDRAPECPYCGTRNPAQFKACENCGGNLSDLFEECPECGHENRLDLRTCTDCGMDLHKHRDERLAEVEDLLLRAARLRDEEEFEEAIEMLERVLAYEGPVFRHSRARATEMLKRVEKLREKAARRTFQEGQHLFRQQRYKDAISTWESIPDDVLDVSDAVEYTQQVMEEQKRMERANRVFLTLVALLLLSAVLLLIFRN